MRSRSIPLAATAAAALAAVGVRLWRRRTTAATPARAYATIGADPVTVETAFHGLFPDAEKGSATFTAAPGGRGTEVVVDLRDPLADPADLRRFKALLETGEALR